MTTLSRECITRIITNAYVTVVMCMPAVSCGLVTGWAARCDMDTRTWAAVSVTAGAGVVVAPMWNTLLDMGRRRAMMCASLAYVMCWSLKLYSSSGVCLLVARVCAGVGGGGVWSGGPVYMREVVGRGDMSAVPVLAHNVGYLLMCLAGDVTNRWTLSLCLLLSLLHVALSMTTPESPVTLVAQGDTEGALRLLSQFRGLSHHHTLVELKQMTRVISTHRPSLTMLLRRASRRRALLCCVVLCCGAELCGVSALLHYATAATGDATIVPLAVGQLVASGLSFAFMAHCNGRRLLVCSACVLCACAMCASYCTKAGIAGLCPTAALCGAVFADCCGIQPVPHVMLTDMFHSKYVATASSWVSAATCVAETLQLSVFPLLAAQCGMSATLLVAAALSALYAIYVIVAVPRRRSMPMTVVMPQIVRAHANNKC